MAILRPITKAQYTVSFSDSTGAVVFNSVFTTFSGINDSSDATQYANGTGNRLFHVVGPRTAENVTLGAPYDPTIFKSLEQFPVRGVAFHRLQAGRIVDVGDRRQGGAFFLHPVETGVTLSGGLLPVLFQHRGYHQHVRTAVAFLDAKPLRRLLLHD